MSDDLERAIDAVPEDRRAFIRKLVIGTAVAAPVVSSFTMTGVQAVYAQTPATSAPRTTTTQPGSTTSTSTTTTNPNTTTTTTNPNTTSTTQNPNQVP